MSLSGGIMSGAKRLMEAVEEKRSKATSIALKARVLKSCEHHEEIFEGNQDVQHAYKLGNFQFERDGLGETFDSRKEMTDYIKEVVEDAPDGCSLCSKMMSDD
jgi:hypothetical protein